MLLLRPSAHASAGEHWDTSDEEKFRINQHANQNLRTLGCKNPQAESTKLLSELGRGSSLAQPLPLRFREMRVALAVIGLHKHEALLHVSSHTLRERRTRSDAYDGT